MSLKNVMARALIFCVLEIGALCGVPMDPMKIEELMNVMKRSPVVRHQTSAGDDDDGESTAESGPSRQSTRLG